MRRYIPKNPLLSGFGSAFIAILLQSTSIMLLGVIYFSGEEKPYIEHSIILLSAMTIVVTTKALHNTCYGVVGRNISNNPLYVQLCPHYKKLHDTLPLLNKVKIVYEYPLSAIGFIDTLDELYPTNHSK